MACKVLTDHLWESAAASAMSGTFLVTDGADHRRIVIMSVTARTPAAESRLRKGDEILAIDGRLAVDLGLEGARELFRQPGRHRLEVRRGSERLKAELVARRLV